MRTFEFATPHGRIGMLILVPSPGNPPEYYWSGRTACPDPIREALTRGLKDPETGKQVAGDEGDEFLEVMQVEFSHGRHLAGRKGPPLRELPKGAQKIPYTAGVSGWFR